MNASSDDAETEEQLVGEWVLSTPIETLEYKFEPQHRFTVKILKAGEEPSCAWGYWDVLDGKLRMGTSAQECKALPIKLEANRFTMLHDPNHPAVHIRRS
jgi:hypothetical protein